MEASWSRVEDSCVRLARPKRRVRCRIVRVTGLRPVRHNWSGRAESCGESKGRKMSRLPLRLIGLLVALMCLSGVTAPSVATATTSSFHYDLFRKGVFVTQYRWTWCVGASSQMMLNIIKGTSNTTLYRQKRLVTYAMRHDGFPNSDTGGSDAIGWSHALTHFGGGKYAPVLSTNFRQSVRRAAKRMRATGKPVGLLVMGGRHAWVLSGFDATADPAKTRRFSVTNVYVLGPLYPKQEKGYFDMPPDTRLTFDQFRTPFRMFDDPDSPQFDGYWVTVSP